MTVDERLAHLERQNRRLAASAFAALMLALLSLLAAFMRTERSEEVSTRKLRLVDERGVLRATLGPVEQGAAFGLVMSDAQGRPRAHIGVGPDGSPRMSFATKVLPSITWRSTIPPTRAPSPAR